MAHLSAHALVIVIPAYNEAASLPDVIHALRQRQTLQTPIVIVNNASTDTTADVAKKLADQQNDIYVIYEARKGTGHACRAGFDYAIGTLHADIIARTDADCVPHSRWAERIKHNFAAHQQWQLLIGPITAKRDRSSRPLDSLFLLIGNVLYRFGGAIWTRSLFPLKFAIGNNMAIRAAAYRTVGGFSATSIAHADEDVMLSKKIYDYYGFAAIKFDYRLRVAVSLRRVRALGGFMNVFRWYPMPGSLPNPDKRARLAKGTIDIR